MNLTAKERWLRTLAHEECDRLIFWPKIFGRGYMQAQGKNFQNLSILEMHDYIGSDIHVYLPSCLKLTFNNCSFAEKKENSRLERLYHTPNATLRNVLHYDAPSDAWHPVELPVKSREDILAMTAFFLDVKPVQDPQGQQEALDIYNKLGIRGLAVESISESPLMNFLEWLAGIENGHYLLNDYTEECEELFTAMHKVNMRTTELACSYSTADVLYFTENTSTTILSPGQFAKYCHHHLADYANICAGNGRRLMFHMCGHIKEILPMLSDIDFSGIEALSSPPIGNTTFGDAKRLLHGKSFIGGTNCMTWIKPQEEIIVQLENYLDEIDDFKGIVVGTGGVIPPACPPETLLEVRKHLFAREMKY